MQIAFPNKTAKEIVEACDNKTSTGKLLYDTGWYRDEDFYTKEKCREGTFEISDEIVGYGKDWNECKEITEKEGGQMLNFAEYVYFIQEYHKANGKYPEENQYKYSWTSSRSSRGFLVLVGCCDAGGVSVLYDNPWYSDSPLGARFSRSAAIRGAKAGQAEADSGGLESAIKMVKEAGYKIFKEI